MLLRRHSSSASPLGRLVLGLGAMVLCTSALATWKWRDGGGKIQYTDMPPPSWVKESDILQRPSVARQSNVAPRPRAAASAAEAASAASGAASGVATAASAASKPAAVDPELEKRLREKEQQEKAAKDAEAAKVTKEKTENCARALSYQKSLQDGLRVARTNERGEKEILDDAARAKELSRTRELLERDCH